jgi:prepilin-type N-terminal cleavage/methylation domain-containing protein
MTNRLGFSLLEVIVVLALLGLLALVPALVQVSPAPPISLSRATILNASHKSIRTGEALTLTGQHHGAVWAVTVLPDGTVIRDSIASAVLSLEAVDR